MVLLGSVVFLSACEERYQITNLEVRLEPGKNVNYNRYLFGVYEGQVVNIVDEKAVTVFQVKDRDNRISKLTLTPSQRYLPEDATIMIGDEIRFSEAVAINMTKVEFDAYRNMKRFLQIIHDYQIPFVSLVDTRPDKLKNGYRVEYLGLEIEEKTLEYIPPILSTKIKLIYEPTGEEVIVAPQELKQLATKWNFILIKANQENPNYESNIRIADGPPPFWFSYLLYRDLEDFDE